MNEPKPDLLDEQALADLEKRRYMAVRSYHSGDHVNWFLTVGIPALCQTVRALRAQNFVAEDLLHVATESLRTTGTGSRTARSTEQRPSRGPTMHRRHVPVQN